MTPHPKGTPLYYAYSHWAVTPIICPVCQGATRLLVKPPEKPNSEGHEVRCEYCRWAERDGLPLGHVADKWNWEPCVKEFVVEGTEIKDGVFLEIRYLFNIKPGSHSSMRHEECFDNKEEAIKKAKSHAENARNKAACEKLKIPNPSHKIGYAKKQIADARSEMERWEKFLNA